MKRVIISGGGTGGHIFPAIAIANALRAMVPGLEILFIGATGRMEMEKVPAAGYPIEGLTVSGLQRRLTWKNLTFPFKLAGSLLKARRIIARFKPDLVIGVGGYASGPTLRMATSMGIPSMIQEQNSFPGVTNRLLAARVTKICVAYPGLERWFPDKKIVMTGNPIRQDVMRIEGKKSEACSYFGLKTGMKTLLVIGGSLGARTINRAILAFVKSGTMPDELQILWQTGKYYFEEISGVVADYELKIKNYDPPVSRIPYFKVIPFIDRMDLAYAAADVIVSRAGAIAISELCVVGKPVILVPSPNVSEDHQTKNAKALAVRNAAILVTDTSAVATLGQAVNALFSDPARCQELSGNIRKLGIANAAEKIAEVACSITDYKLQITNYGEVIHPGEIINPASRIPNPVSRIPNPKSVYLLGIGGIGMSALARYFRMQGASVSGYDRTPTPLTDQLATEGMDIHFTEDVTLIPENPDLVIYTPAVPADNLELKNLRARGIIIVKRAEVLGTISRKYKTIAVAGTHGKTTTSTLVAHILKTAGIPQIAFLGGISKNYGTNFMYDAPHPPAPKQSTVHSPQSAASSRQSSDIRHPSSAIRHPFCVVEADEYDRSFLQLSPYIAIITSADADHLDIYSDVERLKESFSAFTAKIVGGGHLVMKSGVNVAPAGDDKYSVSGYSLEGEATYYAQNIVQLEGLFHFDFVHPGGTMEDLILGLPGRFNLENAVAALAASTLAGIGPEHLRQALLTYQGVRRRFDFRVRRPDAVYIDDYAHHPEELRACIQAVRGLFPGKKITGIFQPHLYSRTRDLADDFARSLEQLDELLLLDIYPAREMPVAGVTSQLLLDRVNLKDKKLIGMDDVPAEIAAGRPEVLLTLGAGDIDQLVGPITEILTAQATK